MGSEESIADWLMDNILSDGTKAPADCLPETGYSKDIESGLSSIFIEPKDFFSTGLFGTRTSTVFIYNSATGQFHCREKQRQGDFAETCRDISFPVSRPSA